MERFARHAPAGTAVAVYLLTAAMLWSAIQATTGGCFAYVLDDAYIHMAVAKNLAAQGTWGVNPGEFASVSSSPLWTLLLGGVFVLAGPLEAIPLILNLLFGVLALLQFHRFLLAGTPSPLLRLAGLLAFLFAVPLPAMAFTGQEHTLHILLSLVFMSIVLPDLEVQPASPGRFNGWKLGILAAALTACRYEGTFLALAAGLLYAIRGAWRRLFIVGIGSALPIVLYGAISLSQGWSLLPNSLLLKGTHLDFTTASHAAASLGGTALARLSRHGPLLVLVLAGLLFLIGVPGTTEQEKRARAAATLFVVSTLLHLQFARTGWFYRYEAWLVALGLGAAGFAVGSRRWSLPDPRRLRMAAAAGLMVIAGTPFVQRAWGALLQIPHAARNIFEQQVQTAQMLQRFFPGTGVAVNDIGAVSYYANVRILDLWGLATMEVARHKLDRTYTTAVMEEIAAERAVAVAAVYDSWFEAYGGFPPSWERVGTWTIRNNIACGHDTVSFYAIVPQARQTLTAALRAYAVHLPSSVIQSGDYLRNQKPGE